MNKLSPASSTLYLTHSELREMPGAIPIEEKEGQTPEQQITLLEDVEKPHWEKRAKEAKENCKNKRAQVLRNVVDTIQLKDDYIRMKNNQLPESEEVRSMLDEEVDTNDLTRFERFKKWAKNNLLALSTTWSRPKPDWKHTVIWCKRSQLFGSELVVIGATYNILCL